MRLSLSKETKLIDEYASAHLGISVKELMQRAGKAVAGAVKDRLPRGAKILVFAGKGNNGGDGYAAAAELMDEYEVTVLDVFNAGQRTPEGRCFLDAYASRGGIVLPLTDCDNAQELAGSADCVIDAVFGTGATPSPSREVRLAASLLSAADRAIRIAVDIPLGVDADDGGVDSSLAVKMTATVTLGCVKSGLVSYPAASYVGELIYDDLGIPSDALERCLQSSRYLVDAELAASLLPAREKNSHKGTFGSALIICGSPQYVGAAHLSAQAALRGGVGRVYYLGCDEVIASLLPTYPEIIYEKSKPTAQYGKADIERATELSARCSATLVGSGSVTSDSLACLLRSLCSVTDAPLVIDADGISSLANTGEGIELIRSARRPVVLTPHPLELSRLTGIPVDEIQASRISTAVRIARESRAVLVLKGAATVVTDGEGVYINSSGSSALAKAGSGDVLSGLIVSLIASGVAPLSAAALAVYYHGAAADMLAQRVGEMGVTPSDLPSAIASVIVTRK